jgi:hypothetical protein
MPADISAMRRNRQAQRLLRFFARARSSSITRARSVSNSAGICNAAAIASSVEYVGFAPWRSICQTRFVARPEACASASCVRPISSRRSRTAWPSGGHGSLDGTCARCRLKARVSRNYMSVLPDWYIGGLACTRGRTRTSTRPVRSGSASCLPDRRFKWSVRRPHELSGALISRDSQGSFDARDSSAAWGP